jgi:hypothetical protein
MLIYFSGILVFLADLKRVVTTINNMQFILAGHLLASELKLVQGA